MLLNKVFNLFSGKPVVYFIQLENLFPGELFIFFIRCQFVRKIPSPSPFVQRVVIQNLIRRKIHPLCHELQAFRLLHTLCPLSGFFLFPQTVQQLDNQPVAVAFIAQQVIQAAHRGTYVFAVLPVHVGYAVFDIIKPPFNLVDEIQHVLLLPPAVKALRLLSLLVLCDPLLFPDPFYPGIVLPHFLQAAFNIHFIDIKVIAGFQNMIFFIDHFFHIAFQMLLQQFPVGLLGQEPFKKFIHIMKHILKGLVQLFGIHQRCFQHGDIHSCIIFKGKKSGVHILDIDIGVFQRLINQLVKGADKNSGIVGNDDIGGHRGIIFHFPQPLRPQKPVQYPLGHGLLRFLFRFRFLLLQKEPALGIHIPQDLHAGFPAQEKIVVLVFIINCQKGFHINIPVYRPEQPPEGGGNLIYKFQLVSSSCIFSTCRRAFSESA